jgi:hypothetical protein
LRPNFQLVGLARAAMKKISKFPLESSLTTTLVNSLHFVLKNDKQKSFLACLIYFLGKNTKLLPHGPGSVSLAAHVKEQARNAQTGKATVSI